MINLFFESLIQRHGTGCEVWNEPPEKLMGEVGPTGLKKAAPKTGAAKLYTKTN